MSRISSIQHNGTRIVFQDFRGLTSPQDATAAFDESRATLRTCAPGTALVLTDFSGSRFNSEMVELARKLAADNKPHIRASALVGLSGLQIVLFTGINRKADRDMRWFDDLEAAKEWLVEIG